MSFPSGEHSQEIASYLLTTLVALGIIGNILLALWRSFREHKILVMPLKLANIFGDLSEVITGLALLLLLLDQDLPEDGICKGGGYLLMFSTLISSGTLLVTIVVLYLWQVEFIIDRGSKRLKGNIKMCTIITASVTGVVWFLGLFFGFLPLIAPDIDTDSAYFYDCIPIRLPGQNSWVYSLILILLICLTLIASFGIIIASFLKIQKLEKEFSDITISQYRTQKRKSLMKRTVRLATVDVMRWIIIMCGVVVAFTGGSSMDRITLKWTLGYILAVGIAVHALLPLIIYLKNTPNKNCLTNKALDVVFQEGFEIPECFQDAKILSSWNKRSGILNLLTYWYHDRRHLDGVMKVFPLHQKQKWASEIKTAAKLSKESHTNVAQYLWASKENRHDEMLSLITGMPFGKSSRIICRAHCELGSLRRLLIDDIQQLTEGSLHSITLDVANGLSHLKSLGILHNKLSAHCIYITGSFQNMIMTGVIADFEESKDVFPAKVKIKPRRNAPAEEVSEVFSLSQLANVDQNLFAPDIRSFALVLLEMVMSLYYFRMRPGKRDTVTASRVSITNSVSPNYQGSTASLKAKALGETGKNPLKVKMPLEKSQDIFDEKNAILGDMNEDYFSSDERIRRSKNLQKHLGLEADKQEAFENELNLSREATSITGLGSKFAPLKLDYRDFGPKPRRDRSIGAYSRHSIKEEKEEHVPEETWDSTVNRVDNRFSPRVMSAVELYDKKVSPVEDKKLRVEMPPLKPDGGDSHVLEYSPNVSDFEDDSKRPSRSMRVDFPEAKSTPLSDSCRLQTNVNLEVDIDGEIDYDVVPYDEEEPPLGASVPIELTGAPDEKMSLAGENVRSHGCESRLEYVRSSSQSNRSDHLSAKSLSLGEDSNSVRSQGCESRLEYVRHSKTMKSDRSSSADSNNQSSVRSGRAWSSDRSSSRSDGCESRLAHYDRVEAVERRLGSFEDSSSSRSNSQSSLYDRWSRGSDGVGHTDRCPAEGRMAHYNEDESGDSDEDRSPFAEDNVNDGAYQFTTVSTMQVNIDGCDAHPCTPEPPLPDAARVISVDTGEPVLSEQELEKPSSAGVRMAWGGKLRTAPEKIDPVSVSKQKNAAFTKGMKDRNSGLRRSLRDRLLPQKIRFQKNKVHTIKFANGPTAAYAKQKANKPINWNGSNGSQRRRSQPAASGDRGSQRWSDSDGGSRPSTAGSRPSTAPDVDSIATPEPAMEPSKSNVSVPCPDLVNNIFKKDDASEYSSSLESTNSSIALINAGSDSPTSDGKIAQPNVEHLLSEDSGIESSYYDDSATGRITRKRPLTGNYETVTEEYILGDDIDIPSAGSSKNDSEKSETDSGEANLEMRPKTDDNHKILPRYFDNNKYLLKQTMPLKVIPKSKPTKQDTVSFETFELVKAAPNPSYHNNGAVGESNFVSQSSRLGDARFNDDDAIYQSIGISLDTCGDGVIMLAKPDIPPRKSHQKKGSSAQNKTSLAQIGGNNDVLILWDSEQAMPPSGSRETGHTKSSSSSAKSVVVSSTMSTTPSSSGIQESVLPKNNIITVVKPRTSQRIQPSKSFKELGIQKPNNLEDDLVVCDLEQTDLNETPVPSPVSFKSTAFQRPQRSTSRDTSRGRDVSLQSRGLSSRADVVSQTSRIYNGSSMAHWSRPNSSIYGDEFQERLTKVAHMTNHVNYGIGSHQICYCKDLSNVFDLLDFDSFINGDESKSEAIMETMFRSGKIGVIGNLMFAMMRVCWFMEQPPTAEDIAEELQYALTSAPPFAVGHV
ncbi:uncharacterized protein LOC135485162 [Lineus longissimus]|uniref:uncharacterized protein LOC135485162 n=1 Tax=Lineus longissimus TaxID=88925 RepID=UPI00315DDF02